MCGLGLAGAGTAYADSAASPSAAKPSAPDEDGEPRCRYRPRLTGSRRRSGFRLALGAATATRRAARCLSGARSRRARAGLRLDEDWSLLASFEYARASSPGGLSGLRFAGTIDPTWHVTPSLSLAVGFGFGGIVEGRNTGRMDAEPFASTLETSYTFADARTPIASCSGVGAAALARIEWGYVLGPRMQGTIGLESIGQWTGCVNDTNRFEPDTGKAIVRRQWWPHTGFQLAIGVTWR
jgi:hypothetical protein